MELRLYLRILQRGWWIIVLTMLAALNVALLVSMMSTPIYSASSRFVISPNAVFYESAWDLVSSMETLDRRSIINTNKELLASSSVYGTHPTIMAMDPLVLEADYDIAVVVIPDTNILRLTVEGPDPYQAVRITQAIGENAIEYINNLYPAYIFSIIDEPKLPTEPISPKPVQNAALSMLVGVIIGVGLAFMRNQLENTFEALRERSTIDNVSGAYTRSYFERMLVETTTQNPDVRYALGLINFKGLKETMTLLPQPIIDRVFKEVTGILIDELRGHDVVARWNATQLSVYLPKTAGTSAEIFLQRIQGLMAEPISLDDTGEWMVHPEPCIGVAAGKNGDRAEEVLVRVEEAMEEASAQAEAAVVFRK